MNGRIPEAVREYLDSKVAAARPKRSARSLPKSKEMEQKEKEGVIVHEEP